jgi:asparagine synthase (glutamine-hydrolysing)
LDLNSVAKFALSTLPREHGVKVVLTGEGSDEHFAGYTWFPVEFLRSPDGGMADSILTRDGQLRENLHNSVIDEMKKMWKAQGAAQYDLEDTDSEVATYASGNTMPDTMLALQAPSIMYQPWVHEQYKGKWDMRETVMKAHSPEIREKMRNKWHPAHTAMYMWNKTNLVNIILAAMGDRAEMAHSIEARTPFLDHHLAEYVNSLPPSVKLHYQPPQEHGVDAVDNFWWQSAGSVLRTITEKWILREAARPFITDELYKRRKVPFLAPVKWPRDGPIHKMFKNLLTREAVENLGFVNHGFIEKALEIGFGDDANSGAFRVLCVTGAWVTLSQRFGIKQATVEKSGWV